jgi:hypothetical protein
MKRTIGILAIYASLMAPTMAADLTVHEWGTFTSFMGSDGKLIEGMHHEDEALPGFVYGLKKEEAAQKPIPAPFPSPRPINRPCQSHSKVGCDTLMSLIQTHSEIFPEAPISAGVTQKMETPVIYFYGDNGLKANVEINFPQGIITQYYPQSTYAYPKFSEARELKDGHFIFDVTLSAPNDTTSMNSTTPTNIWNPARQVPNANVVNAPNGDKEKFIFYRGIGNFPSPLKVTSDSDDVLTLVNSAQSAISMAIVLNSDGVKGNIQVVNNLTDKTQLLLPDLNKGLAFGQYISKTKTAIVEALIKNGLYNDEAVAMVNTWERSYFNTPGIRVLYIVPHEDTEAILPLTIKPLPRELKRVLVGRVEVMTKNEEVKYLEMIKTSNTIDVKKVFGRFYESKLRRLLQIAPEELQNKIEIYL